VTDWLSSKAALLGTIKREGLFVFDEPITLSSGLRSTWYVDLRRALSRGETLKQAAEVMCGFLEQLGLRPGKEYEAVGGMTMGADPLAHAISVVTGVAWFSVRKEAKGHGLARRVEGFPIEAGTTVVVLEDTATTGGSLLAACEEVMGAGATVVRAAALLDRSGQAEAALGRLGVAFSALFRASDLVAVGDDANGAVR
jgi:orotate phosphoribosyltransferase